MNSSIDNFNLEIEEYKNVLTGNNCIYVMLKHKSLPITFADKIEFKNDSEQVFMRNKVVKQLFYNFLLAMKHSKAQTIELMSSFTGDDNFHYVPEYDLEQEKWFVLKNNERIYE